MLRLLKKFRYYIAAFIAVLLLYPLLKTEAVSTVKAGFVIKPKRVLVIDPGHGGEDGGAISITGAVESELNLDISKRLDLIMGLCGVPVVMTRDSEEISYPSDLKTVRSRKNFDMQRRSEIVNSLESPVLLSIHQNNFPGKQPFGAQVFFGSKGDSKALGEYIQSLLVKTLNLKNKRTAEEVSDNIFLLKSVGCSSVLIECAFLSNPAEDALLKTDEYKLRISWAIASAYLGFYGGANES